MRSWSRPRAGRGCGTGWTGSSPTRCSKPPSCTATSRAYSEGNTLVVLDENGARRAGPVHLPPPAHRAAAVHRRLLPAPRRRRARRGRRCSWSPSASRSASTPRSCSPANAYRDYLEVHGLSVQLDRGAGRVLAPPHPLRAGPARRRDRGLVRPAGPRGHPAPPTTAAAGTRSATPPAPTWRTGAKIVDLLGAGAHRRRAVRGVPARPGAVHRRHRRPPPRGLLLQRQVTLKRR